MAWPSSPGALRAALHHSPVIAVLGAHHQPHRAAYRIPAYLVAQGYRVLPVNPRLAGQLLWGERVVAGLSALSEPVDAVNVFRRSDHLMGHLEEILSMRPPPTLVWLQTGIRHSGFAQRLVDAGIDVVSDRCILVEHRRLGLGPPGPSRPR